MSSPSKPPDPPNVIAARYAEAAKKAVSDIAQVAIDAFDKTNGKPESKPPVAGQQFTPDDAIGVMAKLAAATLSGGVALARVGLQVQWDRRVLLVADNVASIVSNGLGDVLAVGEDVAKKAGPKPFKEQQQGLVDSAIQLTGIGVLRAAEVFETVVAGPGAYANPLILRTFTIADEDTNKDGIGDLKRGRPATLKVTKLRRTQDNVDVTSRVTINPPGFTLAADQLTFSIAFNTAGLPSAAYEGEVTATDVGADPGEDRIFVISFAAPDTSDPPEL
jgi:hypothetical protein